MSTEKISHDDFFYSRLRQAMKSAGKKQNEIAVLCNITAAYVSEIIAGKKIPSDRTAKNICTALKISWTWLVTGTGSIFIPEIVADQDKPYLTDIQKKVMEELSHDPVALEMMENYFKLPRSQRYKYTSDLLAQIEKLEAELAEGSE